MVYIGSTVNEKSRMYKHLHDIRHGVHNNKLLREYSLVYSESDFVFDIIEECNEDIRFDRENYWIGEYIDCSCNLREPINNSYLDGVISPLLGKPLTEEHKRKASDGRRGKPNGHEGKKHDKTWRSNQSKGAVLANKEGRRNQTEANIKGWETRRKRKLGLA